ncbi:MG284/MPN403 family protein [Mycoplasma phocoenae]|uniref:Uncharacterized protein n=1 Tax=Mycoplasma phocoenae TaxID=754517 RepID=A0A858U4V5_9MOLU|nr:hypothetical protein [Mycoplasma phocoenae]QJG67081.1 hypothetical protein HGG69_02025 [Mycoplasma phocoenae]
MQNNARILKDEYSLPLSKKLYLYRKQCAIVKKLFHNEITNNKNQFAKVYPNSKEYKTFINKFEYFNESLDPDQRLIFFNEIWNVNADKYWYKNYFSKTTYYKHLHTILDNFYEFINAI